jgi:hypothetical protein
MHRADVGRESLGPGDGGGRRTISPLTCPHLTQMSTTLQWRAHELTDNINEMNVVRLRGGARVTKEHL